ncbi:MAG: MBL fold metallo-hydrolase [Erysipelotrichaceae bacterium]
MKVIYFEHSGFCVEGETTGLIFDYIKGDLSLLNENKHYYVFVSHGHRDHFNKEIFTLFQTYKVTYILSDDCITNEDNVWMIGPNHFLKVDDLEVTTLKSTDEGVAFFVKFEGHCIYHAGDLNDWCWLDESSDQENDEMRFAYQNEIDQLKDESIELAFVVVDPRLKQATIDGLHYFMQHVEVEYIAPMHFWNDYDCIAEVKKEIDIENKMIEINHINQVFYLDEE